MSFEFVPSEHIAHVLGKALDKRGASTRTREGWLGKLHSDDAGDQAALRSYIDGALPGTMERLESAWIFYGQRALFMWLLPFLSDVPMREAIAGQARHFPTNGASGTWTKLRARSTAEKASVRLVRASGSELEAEVWLTKQVHVQHEDVYSSHPKTERVRLRISLAGTAPALCEVYASYQDARKALFAWLDWLRGAKTPRTKSKEQSTVLAPLQYGESLVERLANKHGWGDPTELRGPDPTGEVGSVVLTGHKDGHDLLQLNADTEKVKLQLEVPNDTRRYRIQFVHADGFTESTQASFHFHGAQSRIQFHVRTSRPAIDDVAARIRAELKV